MLHVAHIHQRSIIIFNILLKHSDVSFPPWHIPQK